jgi:hypothetical protein
MVTLTLTSDELEALGYALDLAFGDQEAYMANGSPSVDYGDEWPSVAQLKANQFRAIAQFAGRAGLHGELERWNTLADDLQEHANESCDCAERSWYGPEHDSACPLTGVRG